MIPPIDIWGAELPRRIVVLTVATNRITMFLLCRNMEGAFVMEATIQKWGNSNAIRLPKTILSTANLKENDKVQIVMRQDEIVIRKAKKAHKTWAERFEGYTGTYEAVEFDMSAVGEERFWENE